MLVVSNTLLVEKHPKRHGQTFAKKKDQRRHNVDKKGVHFVQLRQVEF